jgi:hypothetical protein
MRQSLKQEKKNTTLKTIDTTIQNKDEENSSPRSSRSLSAFIGRGMSPDRYRHFPKHRKNIINIRNKLKMKINHDTQAVFRIQIRIKEVKNFKF